MTRAKNLVAALAPATIATVVMVVTIVLAGCAGSGVAERRAPQCALPDTLVCYGKTATKVENRNRLEDVEFCRCERALDIR